MRRFIKTVILFLVIVMSTSAVAAASYAEDDHASDTLPANGTLIIKSTSFVSDINSLTGSFNEENDFPSPREWREDRIYFDIAFVFSIINATLCCVLIFLYLSIWKNTRSEFSIGLVLLSAALLLHSLSANPFFHDLLGFSPYGLGPFVPIPVFFTTLALSVLLYLATR